MRHRLTAARVVGAALACVLTAGTATALTGQPAAPADVTTLAAVAPSPVPLVPAPQPLPTLPAPPAPPQDVPVAPLAALRATDLVVTLPAPLSDAQVAGLLALAQVEAVTLVDSGTVEVGGAQARLVGVDPSEFRSFTPQQTAESDALWQSVARGELAPSHELAQSRSLALGSDLVVGAGSGRIGAVASYGLPGVDVVTDRATARALGVVPSSAVLVSAPGLQVAALRKAVLGVVGQDAAVEVLRAEVAPAARPGRPSSYRELYIDSARYCPGLSWTVLAAIGQVESAHGKHLGPSSAGALGPMQFLPSTWAAYGIDGDGDGVADIMNPFDAVPSSAGYLCRFGARKGTPEGLYDAIFAYNHADWYVKKVLAIAAQYS